MGPRFHFHDQRARFAFVFNDLAFLDAI